MSDTSVIWKFPLALKDEQFIDMPRASETLCVQVQRGVPVLYAHCFPSLPNSKRRFYIHGTGNENLIMGRYVGTFQLNDGALVFHVFEDMSYRN